MPMIDRLNAALAGRYNIERVLGVGGMATVYLAEDLKHSRKVALKVLKPELAAVIGGERFLAEIETTAKLQHPNILPLFDSGEVDSILFYVMPYVEGESLRDRLERERQLPVDEAVRIAVEVAEALASAHSHGVVHRDIKPANILLSQGRPLLADFGIALALSHAGGHRLTETGLSLGTPHYMSPEQATGEQFVGPASDIYSLGCVLYEMLVGEPPYTGGTAQAILGKVIIGEPTPVTEQRRAVPPHVDAVVRKALEKLPADRFASAAELARALGDEGFRHGPVSAGPSTSGRLRAWALAGWVVAVTAGVGWIVSTRSPEAQPRVRALSLTFPEETGPSEWLEITPDGSALIMADRSRASGSEFSLFVQRLDDLTRVPIPNSGSGFDPAVSPDGTSVAFGGMSGLYVAPLTGGAVQTVVEGTSACCLRWGSDGYVYFQSGQSGIYRVAQSGGEPELVLPTGEATELGYYSPIGDGSRAIFSASHGEDESTIESVELATGERSVITQGVRPFLTPDGILVFGRGTSLFAARIDLRSLELEGAPVRMVDQVGTTESDGMYALSEQGHLVYWVPRGEAVDIQELVWVTRTGSTTSVDSGWRERIESVEISPDGTQAAVTVGSLDRTEIWIKDLDEGPAIRLTNVQGMNRRPVWSPDGSSVAFISDRGGRRAVYTVPVEGIGQPELLLEHPVEDVDEVFWSSDGNWLVYRTGTQVDQRDIYARRLRPDTATIVVSAQPDVDERAPVLSPDGRWVAYVSNEAGPDEIWVRPFPEVGEGSRRVSPGTRAVEPVWSDDGRELFFRMAEGHRALQIGPDASLSTGELNTLFPNEDQMYNTAHRAHAYDGRSDRFLMIRILELSEAPAELILVQNFMDEVRAALGN